MNTNGHYKTINCGPGPFKGQIQALQCNHCDFTAPVRNLHRAGDKSGLPRYCRGRAIMVQHLHEKHREALEQTEMADLAEAMLSA